MATVITSHVINDDARNYVVNIHLTGDGGPDTVNGVLVDASSLEGAPAKLRLNKCSSGLTGFTMTLAWDATVNLDFLSIPEFDDERDFSRSGGLPNHGAAGVTGDVLFTTIGAGANDHGTVLLEFIKEY